MLEEIFADLHVFQLIRVQGRPVFPFVDDCTPCGEMVITLADDGLIGPLIRLSGDQLRYVGISDSRDRRAFGNDEFFTCAIFDCLIKKVLSGSFSITGGDVSALS